MRRDERILLAHGSGGRLTGELVSGTFLPALDNPHLRTLSDSAVLEELPAGRPALSTDGFVVDPPVFPGGDLGYLSVCGTVNDLAVAGARPLWLTWALILEEGLQGELLHQVVDGAARAAAEAGVQIVAGDTKVVPRGEGGGLYLATTGVGLRPAGIDLGLHRVRPGDAIVVSGPIGDHGIAVLLAREEFEISGDVRSDCGNVIDLAQGALALGGLRFMRDPTRAGLAGVAWEISRHAGVTVRLRETDVPVRESVQMVCEMLGYDPWYLACEGRVVAVVAADQAADLVTCWRQLPSGQGAAVIGAIEEGPPRIVLETAIAGQRLLNDLEEDPLPRIC